MKGDMNTLFHNLSTSLYFAGFKQIRWPEISEDDWRIVLPDSAGISEREASFIMSHINLKGYSDERRQQELELFFNEIHECFEPKTFTSFFLENLTVTPEYAQAILFRTQNPCKVVLYKNYPVLVVPEDTWNLSDSVFRAFILMGYLPPRVVQNPPDNWNFTDPKEQGYVMFRRYSLALLTEYLRLSELLK